MASVAPRSPQACTAANRCCNNAVLVRALPCACAALISWRSLWTPEAMSAAPGCRRRREAASATAATDMTSPFVKTGLMLRVATRTAWCCAAAAGPAPAWFSSGKKKHFDIDKDTLNPLNKRDDHPYVTGGMKYMPGFSFPAPRELSAIVKYALLERESPETIRMIWNNFHQDRTDSVATIVDEGDYKGFRERAQKLYVPTRILLPVFVCGRWGEGGGPTRPA